MGDGLRATVQRLAMPLIVCGVAVGILLGLLLGWWVWPVQWYDTDPSDLRLQHQVDYVLLASDSLAVTGDIAAARQRLAELTDGDTTWHQIADLVERVAAEREAEGDLAAALRLRRMAQASGLPLASSSEFDPRAGAERPMTLLYAGVAVVVAGLGVAGYLYGRSSGPTLTRGLESLRSAPARARPRASTPASWLDRAVPSTARAMPPVPSSVLDLQGDEDEELYPAEPDRDAGDDAYDDLDDEFTDDWDEEPLDPPAVATSPQNPDAGEPAATRTPTVGAHPGNGDAFLGDADDDGADDWEDEDDADLLPEEEAASKGAIVPVAAPERLVRSASAQTEAPDLPPDALGLFEAEYILGDDDFDSSFTIESPDGEFLGECGVGMTDVLGVEGGVQRADAFEVWLFDKGDIRTVTKVLVSEAAYHDEARRVRLAAKGELIVAQPGLEVILETLSLRVTATLRECEFSEGSDGPEGHFVRLDLEMLAEPSDAVP